MNHNFDKFLEALIERIVDAYSKKILNELLLKLDKTESQDSEILLNPFDAAEFLNVSDTTLWRWTNSGKITAYGICGKRYYKKSELIASLKPLK